MKFIRRYQSEMHGNYKRAWLQYGLITAIAMIMSVLIRFAMVYPIESPFSWTDDIVVLVCLVGFTLIYRSSLPEKRITFKEIYLLDIGICTIASVLFGLFLYYYANSVDTDFPQRYVDVKLNEYSSENSELDYKTYEQMTRDMAYPAYLGFMGGTLTLVTSFIWSFFVALIFKTEKSPLYQKKK